MDKLKEVLELEQLANKQLGEACSALAEASRLYVEAEKNYKLCKNVRKEMQVKMTDRQIKKELFTRRRMQTEPITKKWAKVIPALLEGWFGQSPR